MLSTHVFSDAPDVVAICRAYWAQSGRRVERRRSAKPKPTYVFSVRQLAERFGVPESELRRIVKANCIAFDAGWRCPRCGLPFTFAWRSEVAERERKPVDTPCRTCAAEVRQLREWAEWPTLSAMIEALDD